jgi:hypothetical protein
VLLLRKKRRGASGESLERLAAIRGAHIPEQTLHFLLRPVAKAERYAVERFDVIVKPLRCGSERKGFIHRVRRRRHGDADVLRVAVCGLQVACVCA